MSDAVPGVPEPALIVTPGDRAWRISVTLVTLVFAVTSSALICVTALPTVRFSTAPAVPVVTIASSCVAATSSSKSTRVSVPGVTVVCDVRRV